MRFWILMVVLATVGCSSKLSQEECMELLKKEVAFFKEASPNTPDKMRSLGEAMQNCPSKRSREDYECVMAAQSYAQYASCSR